MKHDFPFIVIVLCFISKLKIFISKDEFDMKERYSLIL